MELIGNKPAAAPFPIDAKPESTEPGWKRVLERMPDDGVPVQVMMEGSREIRMAWCGHYQRTGAWFDAKTHVPIYEPIAHWKARS